MRGDVRRRFAYLKSGKIRLFTCSSMFTAASTGTYARVQCCSAWELQRCDPTSFYATRSRGREGGMRRGCEEEAAQGTGLLGEPWTEALMPLGHMTAKIGLDLPRLTAFHELELRGRRWKNKQAALR